MKNTNKTKKILINKYLERSEGIKFPIYFDHGQIIRYGPLGGFGSSNGQPTKHIVSYNVYHNENGGQLGRLYHNITDGDRYFYIIVKHKINDNIIREYISSYVKGEFDKILIK